MRAMCFCVECGGGTVVARGGLGTRAVRVAVVGVVGSTEWGGGTVWSVDLGWTVVCECERR